MEILSINSFSKYNEIVRIYEENKDKPMKDWLQFDKLLLKPGKQGIVGLFNMISKDGKTSHKVIFKFSQYINYLSVHELTILQGLKDVSTYMPHFCRGIGMVTTLVDAKYKSSEENPFKITNKYPIEKDILLCEYIDNACKFYNYIRSEKIHEDVLYSITKQVMMALCIAQKETNFTHYDCHSYNIMIKQCDKDLIFVYKIDDENQFAVPTLGSYPVIIDFGFSYIDVMDGGPLWPSLSHTTVGFLSDRFDKFADPKLFLVTISDEIKDKRRTKKAKRLRRIVRNMFCSLKIDWEAGWDENDDEGASDIVLRILEDYNTNSELFKEYDYYCIDILQTLIVLPLEEQDYTNLEGSYKTFIKEWVKIEVEINDNFYNLYVLKNIIDAAREIRPFYMQKDTRLEAIRRFRHSIYDSLGKISKFCRPKDVHYEKLLCSLLVFSKCLEGKLFEIMNEVVYKKKKEYDRLPLQTVEQMFGVISVNIPCEYKYNKNTKILLIDNVKKECNMFKLPEDEIDNLNNITHMAHGTYLSDLYEQINH
jgi:hypothetical protein